MNRNDLIGIGVSLGLHALLLLIVAMAPPPRADRLPDIGFVAVEVGPMEEGRPVQRSETKPKPQPQTQARPTPPRPRPAERTAQPIKTPRVQPSPSPEKAPATEPQPQRPAPQPQEQTPAPQPTPQAGDPAGTTGATTGAQGTSTSQNRASLFNIEGLNRSVVSQPMPRNIGYQGEVGFIIEVAPDGTARVLRWTRKGTPEIEREIERAVSRWRFNRLPPEAPQVPQSGPVRARFRLN